MIEDKTIIKEYIILENLTCVHCAEQIKESISKLSNIYNIELDFITKQLTFEISKEDNYKRTLKVIEKNIRKIEPKIKVIRENKYKEKLKFNNNKVYIATLGAIVGIMIVLLAIYL